MSIYKLTADELAPDILLLLVLHRTGKLREAIVRQAIKGACWWISNGQGMGDFCDLWSTDALALRNQKNSWHGLDLVHEHIVPRNVIEETIMQLEDLSVEKIAELLKHSRVCIVTAMEDSRLREKGLQRKLPEGSDLQGGGSDRYALAGITLAAVSYTASDAACLPDAGSIKSKNANVDQAGRNDTGKA